MYRKSALFLAVIIVFMTFAAEAQNGIRVLGEAENVSKRWHFNIGIGYERDIADRLSFGLDFTKGYGFGGNNDNYGYGTDSYSIRRSYTGLQYRCQYFFGGAGYIGTTIGFRQISLEMTQRVSVPSYWGGYEYSEFDHSDRVTVIPVGIRFGGRSELDGWYQDFYLGIGTNLGAGKPIFRGQTLEAKDGLSALWLMGGYAFGIGW